MTVLNFMQNKDPLPGRTVKVFFENKDFKIATTCELISSKGSYINYYGENGYPIDINTITGWQYVV